MAESKNKLLCELRIMQETDAKTPMGAQEIISELETKYGIKGVERRSVYKDMALMESADFGIRRCTDKRKGWYMARRIFTDYELKILCDCVYNMKCITEENTHHIIESLQSMTSERGRKRLQKLTTLSMRNKAKESELGESIETILEAIFSEKMVEFQYTEMDDMLNRVLRREGKQYKLSPYLIYQSANTYYLVGAHDNHDGPTSYRIDRTVNLRITDEQWESPKKKLGRGAEKILKDYVEKSVDNYSGEMIKIVIRYTPDSRLNNIIYDFAGEDVKVKRVDGHTVQAIFKKNDSETLLGWLLKYCDEFQLVEPPELRNRLVSKLKSGLDRYKNS